MLKRKIIFFISLASISLSLSIALPLFPFRSKRIAIHSVLSLWLRLCVWAYSLPPLPISLATIFTVSSSIWTFCFCYKSNVDIDNMFRMPILNWMRSNSIDHRKFPNLTAKKVKAIECKKIIIDKFQSLLLRLSLSLCLPLYPHKCQPKISLTCKHTCSMSVMNHLHNILFSLRTERRHFTRNSINSLRPKPNNTCFMLWCCNLFRCTFVRTDYQFSMFDFFPSFNLSAASTIALPSAFPFSFSLFFSLSVSVQILDAIVQTHWKMEMQKS